MSSTRALATLLLLAGVFAPAEAEPPPLSRVVDAPQDAWMNLEPELPASPASQKLRRSAEGAVRRADEPERTGGAAPSWLRSGGSLAAVVGLIALVAWGWRAMGGAPLPLRSRRPGMIDVISRTMLSPRQSLLLVRIGPRMVLIGATPDALRCLHVIEDPDLTAQLSGEAQQTRSDSNTSEFRAALQSEARAFASAATAPERSAAIDLEQAQSPLRETIARLRRLADPGAATRLAGDGPRRSGAA